MTTPNIKVPRNNYSSQQDESADDWAKTNYNFSPKHSPPADEWGKTAVNINVPRHQPEDEFGKTMPPSTPRRDSNWDATQANINLPRGDYEQDEGGGDYGRERQSDFGATMPYFQLPQSERAKYQNIPPVKPPKTEEDNQKKGGIPTWAWAASGLAAMFLFAVVVLALVYFIFLRKTGFELTVKGAPVGSDIFVDGQRWNLSSADGSYKLPGLKAGEIKTIEVRKAGWTCQPQKVTGENDVPKEIIAQCTQDAVKPVNNECANIKKGDYAKAAKCANDALDNLKEPINIDDLLKAMNLYIINFPSGKYDIVKPEDKAFIQKAAGYIQKLPPDVAIEVGGHTDNVGSKASNQVLSDNRAKSVKNALIAAGVKESVLQTKGYGDSKPKATNDNEDGKFINRRIEYSKASP